MEYLVLLGVGILGYFFMRTITGLKIIPLFRDIIAALTAGTQKSVDKYRDNTVQEFARMSLDKKKKSKKYSYYCFVNEMLDAFGLKARGINVEGVTISVAVTLIVIGIVVSILSSSLLYAIIIPVLGLPFAIALSFLLSRMQVRKRKQELLDSMDIICSVMNDGIYLAVKTNLLQFPDSVRPYFERFIQNIDLLNLSLPRAVELLNEEIGSLYDEFCDSVITYEINRASGMETLFNFYISENAMTMERDRRIKRMADAANMDYFASIGVLILFASIAQGSLATPGMPNAWVTPIGKVVLVLLVSTAAAIFIYIQYLLSKAYIYTEKRK